MFTVKIQDSFCEWTYVLGGDGSDNYSISDLIEAITIKTTLVLKSKCQTKKTNIHTWKIEDINEPQKIYLPTTPLSDKERE